MLIPPKLLEKKHSLEERLKVVKLELRLLEIELQNVEMSIELALLDKRNEQIMDKLRQIPDEWR